MKVTITKSKNAESFYISQSYINDKGKSTSKVIRKLGTLSELMKTLNTDRNGVVKWAKEQAILETKKYKKNNEEKNILLSFRADRMLDYDKQTFFEGGYLFLQSLYYELKLDKICNKIKRKYNYKFDLNAILSDLIYTRILHPTSKKSSYKAASKFLEAPSYQLHDVYRALDIIAKESDFIQSEVYKNSNFVAKRNDNVLFYDCTNYYFEIEQENDDLKYGKSKEHRPNPIIQMGLFVDADGIPLAFSLFPGNQNEQQSLKPLEQKILSEFNCTKFIYCSDAGLGSESNRELNHMGERAFIVTQSIKKLKKEEKEWALNKKGFKRLNNDSFVDISSLLDDDNNSLFYKDEPYSTKNIHQRLIVVYSPKYAAYQKAIREKQIERAKNMIESSNVKKQCKNPNDPSRFVSKTYVTSDGEIASKTVYELSYDKIREEEQYDGLYALCTDLLDDDISDILKVSEGRWQIEACFRTLKTDFSARPVYVRDKERIQAHFLTCFLSLLIYKMLDKKLNNKYTCMEILEKLKSINFVNLNEQGFVPVYIRDALTDDLHKMCDFRTDYQFISKCKMKNIQKKSKHR